jgi:hypothetical protein
MSSSASLSPRHSPLARDLLTLGAAAALLGAAASPAGAAIVLNEFMASNASTIPDEAGDFEDWIEILNTGPGTVNLAGMFLTDNLLVPTRWQIPAVAAVVLDPGERAFVWADAELAEGPLHTNFRLAENGEEIGLFDTIANGNGAIDTIIYGEQATDYAYGRFPDGSGPWIYMATPTPNVANVNQGNIPPLVSQTDHEPNSPGAGQPVQILSRIRDLDGTVFEARFFYDAGAGFVSLLLFDDGLHGDGAPGDQIHGAQVPGFAQNTTVRYYVRARDEDLATTLDPADAPGTTYSYVVGYARPPLFVNEFMAANTVTIADEWGQYDDWVEIYNAGAQPVTLTGLTLSDEFAAPDRYTFPAVVLGPRDFILVWCDGEPAQGPYHASFRLAAAGEHIGLFASAANGHAVIDTLTFGPQLDDVSLGREPDGGATWRAYTRATPRASNQSPIAVEEAPAPAAPALALRVGPNPLSAATAARFTLPAPAHVTLALHDALGRCVAGLLDREVAAGEHALALGPALGGERLAAGVYFLTLTAGRGPGAPGESRVVKIEVLP